MLQDAISKHNTNNYTLKIIYNKIEVYFKFEVLEYCNQLIQQQITGTVERKLHYSHEFRGHGTILSAVRPRHSSGSFVSQVERKLPPTQ